MTATTTKSGVFGALAIAMAMLAAPVTAMADGTAVAADPQPAAEALSPGLAVAYAYGEVRHIRELDGWFGGTLEKAGAPIEHLDWKSGSDKVLTSDAADAVMARITGHVMLDAAGEWEFAAESNDGVKVTVGGVEVVDDPDVHPDRFSEVGVLTVTTPGWHPIEILYFERKNTATLRVMARGPAGGKMRPIKPRMLAHLK